MSKISTRRITPAVIGAVGLASMSHAALADPAPKHAAALKLVQQYCAECHLVAPSNASGWTDAPAFEAIANRPRTTLAALTAYIQKPHMNMLNTGRPPNEANAIADYIMSLRKR